MMTALRKIIGKLTRYALRADSPFRSSATYIAFLREKGVSVGSDVFFHQLTNINIDVSRPSLITIGDKVRFTQGLTILTHDYSWFVLLNKYDDMVGCSGKVSIGNNVFIGFNCTILAGTVVGDNVIIGANSLVKGDVQSDSVYGGVPARRICSLRDFYTHRIKSRGGEISEYIKSLEPTYGRDIPDSLLAEEFTEFYSSETDDFDESIVRRQLKSRKDAVLQKNIPRFKSKSEFLDDQLK